MPPPIRACDDGQVTENPATERITAEDEVAGLCSDLIRIDSTNRGDHSGPGERAAAEHVAALLDEVGLEAKVYVPPGPAHPRPPRRRARRPGGLDHPPLLR